MTNSSQILGFPLHLALALIVAASFDWLFRPAKDIADSKNSS